MKKLLCIALALVMVLGLCACSGEGSGDTGNKAEGLLVGFGREKIMPSTNLTLGGSGTADRESSGYLDILYVTCVAITDEAGETVLVYTQDYVRAKGTYVGEAKKRISEATGIAVEKIMIAATHTHSAPAIYQDSLPNMTAYQEVYYEGAVKAAQTALTDRSAAQIAEGTADAEGYAFSRHYVMADGHIKKTPGSTANPVSHPDDPDDEIQIVKFARGAEDKKDIVLMSFNVHPTFNGQATDKQISADFPGPTRDYIEANSDTLVAYFTGAAGNQGADSDIKSEAHNLDYRAYGQKLGQLVLDAMPNLVTKEDGRVTLKSETFLGTANKRKIDQLSQAREIAAAYSRGGEAACNPLCAQYGIDSVWEANAIIRRAKTSDTISMPLNALSIGELSFIFAPFEMFGGTSMDIKAATPYDMTFIICYANDGLGYLPTAKACEYPVYETFVTNFEHGTAEDVADTFIDMLTELKNS